MLASGRRAASADGPERVVLRLEPRFRAALRRPHYPVRASLHAALTTAEGKRLTARAVVSLRR